LGEQSSVQLVKDSAWMLRDLLHIRANGRRGTYLRDVDAGATDGRSNGADAADRRLTATAPPRRAR
jgi:hypothetical protein